ncbi:unnamed protein product [Phyllotreta striolata]|uniref:t-SNARE coiled-coil homology domain-containing protein n=1 Tax=Phyllotreta striolata TaxID=444603 RepID=A0A9N9U0B5_PHYSR|nr:unnamed protein product [Phyllotreta striolata]
MAKDRLNELKAQVKKNGNDQVAIDVNNDNQVKNLKQTFERAEVLGQWIESIENNVIEIRRNLQKLDNVNVNQRDLSDKIESLFQNNTSICHNINSKLKEIEAELKSSNDESVEGRIKTIQYNSIKTSYTVAFNKNNTELENFRFIQRSNLQAQLRAKGVRATDEELTHLLDNRADIQVFTDNILAETNEAKRVLADIQERHEQLIKIERMLVEVRDMFLQMAILVDGQQDIIDRVEYQAGLARDYIGKAPGILSSAAKKKRKYIKCKIITGTVIIVVVVIIIILAFT